MTAIIRPMLPADATFVVNTINLYDGQDLVRPVTIEQVERGFADPEKLGWIVEDAVERVALIRTSRLDDPTGIADIGLVAVAIPGRGYGRAAMVWALHEAFAANHVHRLWLEVTAHNQRARALYESLGFVKEGIWRDGYPTSQGTFHDLVAYGMLDHEYRAQQTP